MDQFWKTSHQTLLHFHAAFGKLASTTPFLKMAFSLEKVAIKSMEGHRRLPIFQESAEPQLTM